MIIFVSQKYEDPLKWQLVKQFYKIDTLSGINYSYQAKKYQQDNVLEKYKWIRILKSVELHFHLLDHVKNPNKITIPLLVLDYEEVNITQYKNLKTRPTLDFSFKVVFTKAHSFNFLFEVD
jgi:meckelin